MNDLKSCVLLLLTLVLSGCGPDSTVREYEVEREQDKILTSDLVRKEFQPVPFRWKIPEGWRSTANDQFSAFAWTAGPKDAAARITVSVLGGGAGLEPQFVRWRDQLQLPKLSPEEVMKSVEPVALKGLEGQWTEIRGETETILGLIAPYEDKLWIFKYRSANSTVKQERDAFRKFCESLAVE